MFDPVTNAISNQAARRLNNAKRPEEQRAREAGKAGREEFSDTFENAVEQVEQINPVRPLADADREEALEDRQAGEGRAAPERDPVRGPLDLTA